jgi:hypothetical protein
VIRKELLLASAHALIRADRYRNSAPEAKDVTLASQRVEKLRQSVASKLLLKNLIAPFSR